jgi:tRNA nucleotidyltransferase/poly(A) polymerase
MKGPDAYTLAMQANANAALWHLHASVSANAGAVWLVGGTARDLLRGQTPRDWDVVVTGVALDRLQTLLAEAGFVLDAFAAAFGVLKAAWQESNATKTTLDIALPREEVSNGPGHRDFLVRPDPHLALERDLARRDFTINAIAIAVAANGEGQTIVDPFAGQADLNNGIIRAVGDVNARFLEDPLRIWRALRFQARLGLVIEPITLAAMQAATPLLATMSGPRLRDEVLGLLNSEHAAALAQAWQTGQALGLLSDNWGTVLGQQPLLMARLALAWPSFYPPLRLTEWQLPQHDEDTLQSLLNIQLGQIDVLSLRQWLVKTGSLWPQALWLLRQRQPMRDWPSIEAQLQPLSWLAGLAIGDLALKGQEIMAMLETPPGPIIGQWQRRLLQAVVDGEVENDQAALARYILAKK